MIDAPETLLFEIYFPYLSSFLNTKLFWQIGWFIDRLTEWVILTASQLLRSNFSEEFSKLRQLYVYICIFKQFLTSHFFLFYDTKYLFDP